MEDNKYKWLAIGIAALALIWIIYKVLHSIGLIKTAKEREYSEEKDLAQSEIMKIPYFSPSYYKKVKKVSFTREKMRMLAKDFDNAVKNWGTDESKLAGVLAQLKRKSDVSYLNDFLITGYKYDMRDRLIDELDKTELVNVLRQLNGLG